MARKREDNLNPIKTLSKEEAKARGSKGGKASVIARREKKTLAETLSKFLQMQPTGKSKTHLEQLGLQDNEITNQALFAISVFKNGCSGNNKAMEMIAEIIDGNKKKDLEIERQKQEIERLKLEQEKLRRELGQGTDTYEDLTPLAELIKLTPEEIKSIEGKNAVDKLE